MTDSNSGSTGAASPRETGSPASWPRKAGRSPGWVGGRRATRTRRRRTRGTIS